MILGSILAQEPQQKLRKYCGFGREILSHPFLRICCWSSLLASRHLFECIQLTFQRQSWLGPPSVEQPKRILSRKRNSKTQKLLASHWTMYLLQREVVVRWLAAGENKDRSVRNSLGRWRPHKNHTTTQSKSATKQWEHVLKWLVLFIIKSPCGSSWKHTY